MGVAYNGLPGYTDSLTGRKAAVEIARCADTVRERIRVWFLTTASGSLWSPEDVAASLGVKKYSVRSRFTELKLEGFLLKTEVIGQSKETGKSVRLWKRVER